MFFLKREEKMDEKSFVLPWLFDHIKKKRVFNGISWRDRKKFKFFSLTQERKKILNLKQRVFFIKNVTLKNKLIKNMNIKRKYHKSYTKQIDIEQSHQNSNKNKF